MKNQKRQHKRRGWNTADKQGFADGLRTRAVTIHHKPKPAPERREWD
jgi:hypothetical protein